jgi:hypothetical protein
VTIPGVSTRGHRKLCNERPGERPNFTYVESPDQARTILTLGLLCAGDSQLIIANAKVTHRADRYWLLSDLADGGGRGPGLLGQVRST